MYVTRIGRPDFSTKRDFVDNVSFEVYMLATLYHSENVGPPSHPGDSSRSGQGGFLIA